MPEQVVNTLLGTRQNTHLFDEPRVVDHVQQGQHHHVAVFVHTDLLHVRLQRLDDGLPVLGGGGMRCGLLWIGANGVPSGPRMASIRNRYVMSDKKY